MPPKKKLGKELPIEGLAQAVRAQVLETTQAITQPQTTAHPHIATTETGRPEEPLQQPTQLQVTEAQEDQEQE
jgi:hypothetical protein